MHTNSHTRILKASQGNFKLRLRPLDIELRWLRSFLAQLALPTYLGRPAQARRTRRRKSSGTRTATNTMTIRTRLARIAGAHFDRLAQNWLRWGFHGNWNWNSQQRVAAAANRRSRPSLPSVVGIVIVRRASGRLCSQRKWNITHTQRWPACHVNVAAFEVVSASFQRATTRTADVCYWSSMPGGLSRAIVIVISVLFIKSAA